MAAPITINESAPTLFIGDEADSSAVADATFDDGDDGAVAVVGAGTGGGTPCQVVGPYGLPATMPAAATRRVAMRRMEYMMLVGGQRISKRL